MGSWPPPGELTVSGTGAMRWEGCVPGAPEGAGEAGVGAGAPGLRERVGLAVRERLPVWAQARCAVDRRAVLALAVVLVVAALFAARHFWVARPEKVGVPQVVRTGEPLRPSAATGPAAAAGMPATPAGGFVVVDIGGKVRAPGVRRLPAGSRVADALKAAGGVRPGVNTDGLNRARFLVDGEKVLVGVPAQAVGAGVPVAGVGGAGSGGAVAGGGAVGGGAGGAGPVQPVSLGTATVDQLDSLPGVGPVLAQHIVDYRTRHGGFRSVEELREVNGIGERRFADLRELVRP